MNIQSYVKLLQLASQISLRTPSADFCRSIGVHPPAFDPSIFLPSPTEWHAFRYVTVEGEREFQGSFYPVPKDILWYKDTAFFSPCVQLGTLPMFDFYRQKHKSLIPKNVVVVEEFSEGRRRIMLERNQDSVSDDIPDNQDSSEMVFYVFVVRTP